MSSERGGLVVGGVGEVVFVIIGGDDVSIEGCLFEVSMVWRG